MPYQRFILTGTFLHKEPAGISSMHGDEVFTTFAENVSIAVDATMPIGDAFKKLGGLRVEDPISLTLAVDSASYFSPPGSDADF